MGIRPANAFRSLLFRKPWVNLERMSLESPRVGSSYFTKTSHQRGGYMNICCRETRCLAFEQKKIKHDVYARGKHQNSESAFPVILTSSLYKIAKSLVFKACASISSSKNKRLKVECNELKICRLSLVVTPHV